MVESETSNWSMVGEDRGAEPISYERDWRYVLIGEAIIRATMADHAALEREFAGLSVPQSQRIRLSDLAGTMRYDSIEVAAGVAEALRTMRATPGSEAEVNATLEAVVKRALELRFHLTDDLADAIVNPAVVKCNRDAERGAERAVDPELGKLHA